MTPDRLAKIRAEFERLATAQGLNCDFLWDVADSCYAHQDTDDIFQGFLLAHTSSEMAKDAAIARTRAVCGWLRGYEFISLPENKRPSDRPVFTLDLDAAIKEQTK